jgi:hypothetical protein
MAVVLTTEQLDFLAKTASWKFDVDFKDLRDSVTYTGDGVDDLDMLINRLTGPLYMQPKILCDVGKLFSSWIIVTVDDIYALRGRYIEIHGTASKPPEYYDQRAGSTIEVTGTTYEAGNVAGPNPEGNYGDFTDYGDGRGRTHPSTTPDQVVGL